MEEIRKAREFYGIFDYVSDDTVKRLIETIKTKGIEYARNNTGILKKLSYKKW